jgi:hypothetical protein
MLEFKYTESAHSLCHVWPKSNNNRGDVQMRLLWQICPSDICDSVVGAHICEWPVIIAEDLTGVIFLLWDERI